MVLGNIFAPMLGGWLGDIYDFSTVCCIMFFITAFNFIFYLVISICILPKSQRVKTEKKKKKSKKDKNLHQSEEQDANLGI